MFGAGGIEIFNRHFLKSATEWAIDKQFTVFLLNDRFVPRSSEYPANIRFICCGSRLRIWSKVKLSILFVFALLRVRWSPSRKAFVFCGHINLAPLCLGTKMIFNIKYAIFTYGIEVWSIENWIKLESLRRASRIISISHFTATKIKNQLEGIRPEKIVLLPPTIDGNHYMPQRKPVNLLQDYDFDGYKVMLTVARLSSLEKYKGYDNLIKAMPKILNKVPNFKYCLIGSGDDVPRVNKLIRSLNLEDHVTVADVVSDNHLLDYYNLCDLFVMPSKMEGFGIVFLEALACGKPVIAGSKDGSREALLDGRLGILVDPDNIDEIAQAIIDVIEGNVPGHLLDPRYLRKTVLEEYGLDIFKQRVSALLEALS